MDGWMDLFPFSETCSLIGFVPRVNNGPLIRLVNSTSLTKQYRFIIVKNKNSYTNKASKINTGNNPDYSLVFPVFRWSFR